MTTTVSQARSHNYVRQVKGSTVFKGLAVSCSIFSIPLISDNPLIKLLSIGLGCDESAPKPLLIGRHSRECGNPARNNHRRSRQNELIIDMASFEERPNSDIDGLCGAMPNCLGSRMRQEQLGVLG